MQSKYQISGKGNGCVKEKYAFGNRVNYICICFRGG